MSIPSDGNSLRFNIHTVNCVADIHKDVTIVIVVN